MEHNSLEYNDALEKLLCKEAERCLCLRWVHSKAQAFNASWNTRLAIPTIILGTLAGSAGLAGEQLLPFNGATTLIGLITLLCSILNTVSAYYAFAKKSESHRVAMIHYQKLHRTLELELALPRKQRMSASHLLELLKTETERLNEIVPLIDESVMEMFRARFHDDPITKPPELNGLEQVLVCTDQENKITIIEHGSSITSRGSQKVASPLSRSA